jgi:hypothetical protein
MNRGRCLCGAVHFEAGSFAAMTHCHCSMCRRHHGAMFATFLDAPRAAFRWISGEEEIVTYRSSGRGLRTFCRRCGSALPTFLPDWPDVVTVPAGLVEGDPGIRPKYHEFAASAPDWFPIADALPRHATRPAEFDAIPTVDNPGPPPKDGVVQGRCLCGDVAFELTGAPEVVQNCHCTRCRRARGAAHATNAFFRGEQLAWIRGEEHVVDFPLPGAKRFGQAFCARCGGKVPRIVASTGYVVVPCASLDGSPGRPPRGHIFVGSKAPWYDIADRLPQWEELPA